MITVPACDRDITLYGANVIETRCPAEPAGAFVSNDEYLNGIYQMSIDTAKVCMMDSYVDCCGCEQNTWVGDAGITAEINMVNFGERAFDARYLDMIGRSLEDGMLEFHRFNNGVRTQFYGNVPNCTTIFGETLLTDAFKFGEKNHIKLTTKNESDGVRIILNINGEDVIDILILIF